MGVLKCLDWIPEFFRFALSGMLGTVLDFAAYKLLYDSGVFPLFRATLSWTVAYTMSVVWQHALHALLVFGSFGTGGYCRSLGTTYMAYGASIAFSPLINWSLAEYARMNHTVAWFATLGITGIANYILLSKSMQHAPPALVILSGGVPLSEAMRGAARDRRDSGVSSGARRSPVPSVALVSSQPEPGTPCIPGAVGRSMERGSAAVARDGGEGGLPVALGSAAASAQHRNETPLPHSRQSTVVTIGAPKPKGQCCIS